MTTEKGGREEKKERREQRSTGRHVSALRGHGRGQRLRPDGALRRHQVAQPRARSRSPATAWTAGTAGSSAAPACPWTSRSRSTPRRSCTSSSTASRRKIKVEGVNLTYEGVIPKIQKSMLSKDVEAMQPHVRRVRRAGGHLHDLPRVRRHPAQRRRRGRRRSTARTSPTLCAMQISDLADWVRGPRRAVGGPAARRAAAPARLVRRDRAGLPLARPAGGHPVRGRGAAHQDDPPPRLVAHRRHLRLRRAHDRPAPARHRADERAAAAAAGQGQHRARRGAQARDDRDRRPRGRPRPGRRHRRAAPSASRARVEGLRASDTITGRHLDDRASPQGVGAGVRRGAGGPRRVDAQPPGRGRRHPAGRALRRHRRRRAPARAR